MKKLICLLAAALCFTLGSAAALAKAAPDAALTGLNTADATVRGLAGEKPLYLNFWATWCPPCVGELPAIEAMYQTYGDRLHFAAVSIDDGAAQVKAFVERRGLTVPVYMGDTEKLTEDYRLQAIPVSLLIGTDGELIAEHVGGMDKAALEAFLSRAL